MTNPQNLFDDAVLADPWAFYAERHAAGIKIEELPDQNMFIVYGYDLCLQAATRPAEFSSEFGGHMDPSDQEIDAIMAEGWKFENTLLTVDAPLHTRNRKLVNLAFSMRRVNAIEQDMREKAIALIDAFSESGECEFAHAFAIPLPVAMIAQQIGLEDDTARVKRWSDSGVDRFSQKVSRERQLECARELVEYQHYMMDLIEQRRAKPTDDLLTDLVEARVDDETPLSDAEVMSMMHQFMVAGNETTTSTLTGALLELIGNEEQMAHAVSAAGGKDPRRLMNLVEEALRFESPAAGMWRIAAQDTQLGDMSIPKGATVHLRYAAANRDPAVFEDPDSFNIDRKNAKAHLSFGKGPHVCVGNMLSRKEMLVAFDELLSRLTNFEVADRDGIEILRNVLLRGVTRLPIRFRPI
ncbi:MAG: cytochrome P450 [Pseudomonadota bacterium]